MVTEWYTIYALWAAFLGGVVLGIGGGAAVFLVSKERLYEQAHQLQQYSWQEYLEALEEERDDYRRQVNVLLAVSENLDNTLADRLARKTAGCYVQSGLQAGRKKANGRVVFDYKRIHKKGLWRTERMKGGIVEVVVDKDEDEA